MEERGRKKSAFRRAQQRRKRGGEKKKRKRKQDARLPVNIDETVELAGTSGLGRLVVVGETGTGEVERVDEKEGRGSGGSTGSDVSGEPGPVTLGLLEAEEGLEVVLEGD